MGTTTIERKEPVVAVEQRPNGVVSRVLQFGQMLVIGAFLPWGVWVTSTIFATQTQIAQLEDWRKSRDKAAIATITDVEIVKRDVELARLKVKDELMTAMATKMDAVLDKLNAIDKAITKHMAETTKP